jgi:chloride channel protein, CIC family
LVTTVGALTSSAIVARLAPEAEGQGTDNAIEAVRTDPRAIRVARYHLLITRTSVSIYPAQRLNRETAAAEPVRLDATET